MNGLFFIGGLLIASADKGWGWTPLQNRLRCKTAFGRCGSAIGVVILLADTRSNIAHNYVVRSLTGVLGLWGIGL
jgi:hypothetical protein